MDHSETKNLLKTDYTPATLDDPSKRLLEAAAFIEANGWCSLNAEWKDDGEAPHCASNAIYALGYDDASTKATERLSAALGGNGLQSIWQWNDAPGRTKEQVLAKLRAVALS